MNVVFMNTLEKQTGEDRVKTAQVSIGEAQGIWNVLWNEPDSSGKVLQEQWYQGGSWDELLSAFRQGLKEKMVQGFRPLVSMEIEGAQGLTGKARMTQMLDYYSELNPNETLYESLRVWRREQAAREGKAPFILATNRVLRMIAVYVPQTSDELRQIPGFGEQKVAMYGTDLLKFTAEIHREHSFPLDWVARTVDIVKFEAWVTAQREQKMRLELDREANKRKLLEIVAGAGNLEALQEGTGLHRRELLLWIEELEREGYDMEPLIDAELQAISEDAQIKAWNAFEIEGDRYLKPVLQHLMLTEELKGKELDRTYEWLRLLRLRYRREKEGVSSQAS